MAAVSGPDMAAAAQDGGTSNLVQPEEPKQETVNGTADMEKAGSPAPEEPVKEGSGAEDSDATVRSTSEDTSPPSPRYGLRPKRSRFAKEGSLSEEGEEDGDDGNEGRQDEEGKGDERLPNAGKHRRKRSQYSGKQADASKPDGLLRLAQIAHAAPRMPKKQRVAKGQAEPEAAAATPVAEPTAPAVKEAASAAAAAPQEAPVEAPQAAPAAQAEQKITPAQLRAVIASGQQLDLPGFTPCACPHVLLGARWQLDLRTGERLEEQPAPPQMGLPHHMQMGQVLPSGSMPASYAPAGAMLVGQALGTRPPIFTGPPPQAGQMPPQGGYGVVPPPNNYAGSLPIPALGQQPLSQGGTPTGPYTALLGSQMQPLLPPGVLPGQYPPPNFASMPGVNAHLGQQLPQQQPAAVPPKKRQRSSHAAELADLPEIPLRRRGRPAGDGAANPASPHELQERRMQANRAAASRSHFRRKREMEILEKECSTIEARVADMRANVAAVLAQEEQLRLQQAGIREHLAAGCKPGGGETAATAEEPAPAQAPAQITEQVPTPAT